MALIDTEKGEQKAQSSENACLQQLPFTTVAFVHLPHNFFSDESVGHSM